VPLFVEEVTHLLVERGDRGGVDHQFAVMPPSITSSLPVTHEASSEAGGPHSPCPDRARAAPCSSRRAVPRILLVARARSRVRARNILPLWPHPVTLTSARSRRQCDGSRLHSTFLGCFDCCNRVREGHGRESSLCLGLWFKRHEQRLRLSRALSHSTAMLSASLRRSSSRSPRSKARPSRS
jgi:hypothetical protein